MMKYALLIYVAPGSMDGMSDDERAALTAEYMAIREDPRCLDGAQLQPIETATTVRVPNGKALITDGPFADTKEVFGGFYLFEADGLDDVLEVAEKVPATRMGGSVEVRALVESY
jgi:hypothetical protein